MQIDPVAMVEHLGDEEALAAAKAIQTKRYIGYLRDVSGNTLHFAFLLRLSVVESHGILDYRASVASTTVVWVQRLAYRDHTSPRGPGEGYIC